MPGVTTFADVFAVQVAPTDVLAVLAQSMGTAKSNSVAVPDLS
jgi:hypothetical protein